MKKRSKQIMSGLLLMFLGSNICFAQKPQRSTEIERLKAEIPEIQSLKEDNKSFSSETVQEINQCNLTRQFNMPHKHSCFSFQ